MLAFEILEKEMLSLSYEHQLKIFGGNSSGGYYFDGYWDYIVGEHV
ncbi:hypothetical protein ACFRAE_17220 [Sphingobacterium sp. HJSM2_6]